MGIRFHQTRGRDRYGGWGLTQCVFSFTASPRSLIREWAVSLPTPCVAHILLLAAMRPLSTDASAQESVLLRHLVDPASLGLGETVKTGKHGSNDHRRHYCADVWRCFTLRLSALVVSALTARDFQQRPPDANRVGTSDAIKWNAFQGEYYLTTGRGLLLLRQRMHTDKASLFALESPDSLNSRTPSLGRMLASSNCCRGRRKPPTTPGPEHSRQS